MIKEKQKSDNSDNLFQSLNKMIIFCSLCFNKETLLKEVDIQLAVSQFSDDDLHHLYFKHSLGFMLYNHKKKK